MKEWRRAENGTAGKTRKWMEMDHVQASCRPFPLAKGSLTRIAHCDR